MAFLVVQLETAGTEEGVMNQAELGVQIAELGLTVGARLPHLAPATVVASATEVMGEFGLASTLNSTQEFGPPSEVPNSFDKKPVLAPCTLGVHKRGSKLSKLLELS
jgi:hypothetical protein